MNFPERVPAHRTHRLSPQAEEAKRRALAEHRSQVAPLSALPGDEAVVDQRLLSVLGDRVERFVLRVPDEPSPFEDLHRRVADPWQVRSSWYERRKRAITLSLLPREQLGHALEVGGSIGELAHDLTPRCDRLVVVDESPAAVEAARARLAGRAEVVQARLPEEWDRLGAGGLEDARWDLVVLSEVGYFLSPGRLTALAGRVAGSLRVDGCVVACHWRHPVVGWPLRGDDVHALLDSHLGLRRVCHLVEEDAVHSVWLAGDGVAP